MNQDQSDFESDPKLNDLLTQFHIEAKTSVYEQIIEVLFQNAGLLLPCIFTRSDAQEGERGVMFPQIQDQNHNQYLIVFTDRNYYDQYMSAANTMANHVNIMGLWQIMNDKDIHVDGFVMNPSRDDFVVTLAFLNIVVKQNLPSGLDMNSL